MKGHVLFVLGPQGLVAWDRGAVVIEAVEVGKVRGVKLGLFVKALALQVGAPLFIWISDQLVLIFRNMAFKA